MMGKKDNAGGGILLKELRNRFSHAGKKMNGPFHSARQDKFQFFDRLQDSLN